MTAFASSTDNGGFTSRVSAWLKSPFDSQMDALSWALFIGFALIVVFFWTRVLNYIGETV